MAVPFPDRGHPADDRCRIALGTNRACLEDWRMEERKVSLMLLLVPILVFAWKMAIVAIPSTRIRWFNNVARTAGEDPEDGGPARRAIEYQRAHDRYTDDAVVDEGADENRRTGVRQEIDVLNDDSQLASLVSPARDRERDGA
ncbi:hypothetical protein LTR66_009134 [Elasticomyces elasticus]|nr:hypothetical protein LTR66_009134 [Elasticomyces elasticus]